MRTKALYCVAMLSALLALSILGGGFTAEGTLHPARRPLVVADELQAQGVARSHNADFSDVVVVAGLDGTTLRAWSIRPRSGRGETVILLHGLSDNRLGMTSYADLLLSHGFDVLMPDARAHGASGGPLATYGLVESDDIHRWVDWVEHNQHPKCIFAFGESMGAAQLLQSLKKEERFCAVAVESPFASFREIAYDRVGQFFHTGPWLGRTILRPVVDFAFVYARWRYKLDFEQLSPQEAVAASNVPVLLIHGAEDSNIPIRHSRMIADAKVGISLWEVPHANHCGAISVAPGEFEQKLTEWFALHSF